MYHTIEFRSGFTTDVVISPKQRLECMKLSKGDRVHVHLIPHVIETLAGPVETADLCFEGGSVALQVPFVRFRFVE